MSITIFGLPDPFPSNRVEWFAVSENKAAEYLANHHMYSDKRNYEIQRLEVDAIGIIPGSISKSLLCDNNGKCIFARVELVYPTELKHLEFDNTDAFHTLSEDASALISEITGADGGTSAIPLRKLAKIVKTTKRDVTVKPLAGHGPYAQPTIRQILVEYEDGETEQLYSVSVGYFEGYMFDLFTTLKDATRCLCTDYDFATT